VVQCSPTSSQRKHKDPNGGPAIRQVKTVKTGDFRVESLKNLLWFTTFREGKAHPVQEKTYQNVPQDIKKKEKQHGKGSHKKKGEAKKGAGRGGVFTVGTISRLKGLIHHKGDFTKWMEGRCNKGVLWGLVRKCLGRDLEDLLPVVLIRNYEQSNTLGRRMF